ncbi:MAG: A/G-specific adenine glycosylase [Actinomyces urogenitalis]|uniref:A/G-specific adenine glycosylase n=1 Tax=Actinomyces urogenitalis TaxID=103621 RepID=UPI002A807770|nr:A/G-specific adenine glycosylase [Actinomyces urogenitalis]MDY3678504.1 A/G-specific adenine glycosylase [Actinomyces urogenitalis]
MSAARQAQAGPDPRAVVDWYRAHARDLPWRHSGTSAYAVLVSEVMSQQTPVPRVVPAWQEWMRRWPDATALAGAQRAEVLLVWGRLGYPRRALRLVEAARAVVERHGGELPADRDQLLALPGVGDYTAGAVLAFAYGRRALTLDTNVRRVLARVVGGQALPAPSLTRAERERAEALLPPEGGPVDPAQWSVAVMELGALVCTARDPRCQECPWAAQCRWVAQGKPADEHAGRRRSQAWHGTDRQARGLVMARLRLAGPGTAVARADLLAEATRAGQASGRRRLVAADPEQPARALAGLLADGLIATDDDGASFRLP